MASITEWISKLSNWISFSVSNVLKAFIIKGLNVVWNVLQHRKIQTAGGHNWKLSQYCRYFTVYIWFLFLIRTAQFMNNTILGKNFPGRDDTSTQKDDLWIVCFIWGVGELLQIRSSSKKTVGVTQHDGSCWEIISCKWADAEHPSESCKRCTNANQPDLHTAFL